MSVAYAIWAGVGTVLIVGVLWLREPVSLLKVASIGLIALGVAGLHLSSISGEL